MVWESKLALFIKMVLGAVPWRLGAELGLTPCAKNSSSNRAVFYCRV